MKTLKCKHCGVKCIEGYINGVEGLFNLNTVTMVYCHDGDGIEEHVSHTCSPLVKKITNIHDKKKYKEYKK